MYTAMLHKTTTTKEHTAKATTKEEAEEAFLLEQLIEKTGIRTIHAVTRTEA